MAWKKESSAKAAPTKRSAKAAQTKPETKPAQEMHTNEVEDWLLWCFEQEQRGDYLRMTCKLPSRPPKDSDDKHGKGLYITVMARIQPDEDGWMTDIAEDDYSSGWVHVTGAIRANDWIDKYGMTHTVLTIWAEEVAT